MSARSRAFAYLYLGALYVVGAVVAAGAMSAPVVVWWEWPLIAIGYAWPGPLLAISFFLDSRGYEKAAPKEGL